MKKAFDVKLLTHKVIELLNPYKTFNGFIELCPEHVQIEDFTLKRDDKIHLFGVGKAASFEVSAFLQLLNENIPEIDILQAVALTKDGHLVDNPFIQQLESSHPNIQPKNIENSKIFVDALTQVKSNEKVLFFISGGASALLEIPRDNISLDQLQNIYNDLLTSGKNINEMNQIRKSLSQTKNGGLLKWISSKNILQFITCDIPNETLADVGSGPLLHKPLDWGLINIYLEQFHLRVSPFPESPDSRIKTLLCQSGSRLIENLINELPGSMAGKVYDDPIAPVINDLISLIPKERKKLHISGGEATVQVTQTGGRGGRNTHFVLQLASTIYKNKDYQDVRILCLGTDGTDGETDAAGAYIDYSLFAKLNAKEYLDSFNSYEYFKKLGSLVKTGPTRSNVMDVRFLWRE